jgi:murein DD-endopeptidase MepM/ murein hydrolase activator NlpD
MGHRGSGRADAVADTGARVRARTRLAGERLPSRTGRKSRTQRAFGDVALAWPSAYPGVVTQRWGPVSLVNEPAGYADAQKADSSNFSGAVYGAHVHRGLDIRAYEGTNLYAAEAGTIVKAQSFSNGELYMQLRINPTTVLQYDHCSAFVAKVGDTVARGQLIAKAGSTGNVTAAHLHFEVQITEGGRVFRYNPALFLAGGAFQDDPRILPAGAAASLTAMSYAYRVREYPTPRTFTLAAGSRLNFYDPEKPNRIVYSATFPVEWTGQSVGVASMKWKNVPASPVPDSGGAYAFEEVGDVTPYPAGGVEADTYKGLLVVTATPGLVVSP